MTMNYLHFKALKLIFAYKAARDLRNTISQIMKRNNNEFTREAQNQVDEFLKKNLEF